MYRAGAVLFAGLTFATAANAADKVSFGTNWLAEAEHGGYYQALVDGTYAKYGLDVTIVPGGPQANNGLLLAAGKLDFYMGGNLLLAFDAVDQNLRIVVVAAHFQKDPQMVMSHPGVGLDKWQDLPQATAFIGKEGLASFYRWMETAYGFKEANVKPYTFNPAPFIADKNSIQQGYVTSEPYSVEKEGGFKPNIFLFADQGYDTYATTIETRADVIETRNRTWCSASSTPRPSAGTIISTATTPRPTQLIKKDNPEMTDEQIAFSIAKMKEYGLVDSGDTLKHGIGAMTDERVKSFYDQMVKAGVVKPGLDYKKAYTLEFVNKGVGLDLRPK